MMGAGYLWTPRQVGYGTVEKEWETLRPEIDRRIAQEPGAASSSSWAASSVDRTPNPPAQTWLPGAMFVFSAATDSDSRETGKHIYTTMPTDLCAIHPPRLPGARVPVSLHLTVEAGALLAELSARLGRSRRAIVEEALAVLAAREGLAP